MRIPLSWVRDYVDARLFTAAQIDAFNDKQTKDRMILLDQLQRAALGVSDAISMKFFSHAVTRSVLSLVA